MHTRRLYGRIIAGEAGAWAAPIRAALWSASGAYRLIVNARNRHYDRNGSAEQLPVPVISVGNVTAGGTGKTPLVVDLLQRLDRRGHNPAMVSRGYASGNDGAGDEERLVRDQCPGAICVTGANRVAAASRAMRHGADVVVLDDAFQHRRLARDMDIVLIDATNPFGFGHLLPRGLLREPLTGLQRASLIVVTRIDQASASQIRVVDERLRRIAPHVRRLRCVHRVHRIHRLGGGPMTENMEGIRAALFAGIANPQSFVTTVRLLGMEVVGGRFWPDHHRYTASDLERLTRGRAFPPHDVLLTTEKDAVKLVRLSGADQLPIGVVCVRIDFGPGDDTILDQALDEILDPANRR